MPTAALAVSAGRGGGGGGGGRTGEGGVRTPRSQCPARFCQNGAGWESARGGRAALLSGPGGGRSAADLSTSTTSLGVTQEGGGRMVS